MHIVSNHPPTHPQTLEQSTCRRTTSKRRHHSCSMMYTLAEAEATSATVPATLIRSYAHTHTHTHSHTHTHTCGITTSHVSMATREKPSCSAASTVPCAPWLNHSVSRRRMSWVCACDCVCVCVTVCVCVRARVCAHASVSVPPRHTVTQHTANDTHRRSW